MKPNQKVNTKSLQKQAEESEDKEAYQQVSKTAQCRVGIGARIASPAQPSFFVEIIVNLCPAHGEVDLAFLERALTYLKALKNKGYTLTFQDDNCILCEKFSSEQNLKTETEVANALTEKKLQTNSQ